MGLDVTARAEAVPLLLTDRLAPKSWLTSTVNGSPAATAGVRTSARVAARAAGASTVTDDSTGALSVSPETASVPLAVSANLRCPLETGMTNPGL